MLDPNLNAETSEIETGPTRGNKIGGETDIGSEPVVNGVDNRKIAEGDGNDVVDERRSVANMRWRGMHSGNSPEGSESIECSDGARGDDTVGRVLLVPWPKGTGRSCQSQWLNQDFVANAEQLLAFCSPNVCWYAQDLSCQFQVLPV